MHEPARPDDTCETDNTAPLPVSRVRPWNAVNRPFYYEPTFWVLCGVIVLFTCFAQYYVPIIGVPVICFRVFCAYKRQQDAEEREKRAYRENRARWARLAGEEAAARESKGA